MTIEKEKNLKEFTTFRIGGNAQFFCAVESEADLLEAITFAKSQDLPIFILGGGSNILISDAGFRGLVIKMEMKGIEFTEEKVTVKAGENWDEFVNRCVDADLYGLENLSLIPGTVGATPVQNIGAYGSEVKDTIESVRVFDIKENVFKDLLNKECDFGYRSSMFKKEVGRYVIVSVTFSLKKEGTVNIEYRDLKDYFNGQNPTLGEVRDAVVTIRTRKLPDVRLVGTVGSFFKNNIVTQAEADALVQKYPGLPIYPFMDSKVKISVAWLLDKVCGYKGVSKGDVGTYKNQALVLVNNGNATAEEIISFANEIKKTMLEKTGIMIEEEVQMI